MLPRRFVFTPKADEQVDAVITLPAPQKSILHGTVTDSGGTPVKNAVLRLFELSDDTETPLGFAVSDDRGEYVFGPLKPAARYEIKVYTGDFIVRKVNLRPRKRKK